MNSLRFCLLALWFTTTNLQASPTPAEMIGIAPEQTLRLSVMAHTESMDGACKVSLGFLDRHGKSAGPRFAKHIVLEPGQTVYLDIQGRDVTPGGMKTRRVELLPTVSVEPDTGNASPCPGVMAGVEVFDQKSGPDVVSVQKSL